MRASVFVLHLADVCLCRLPFRVDPPYADLRSVQTPPCFFRSGQHGRENGTAAKRTLYAMVPTRTARNGAKLPKAVPFNFCASTERETTRFALSSFR